MPYSIALVGGPASAQPWAPHFDGVPQVARGPG